MEEVGIAAGDLEYFHNLLKRKSIRGLGWTRLTSRAEEGIKRASARREDKPTSVLPAWTFRKKEREQSHPVEV